MRTTHVMHVDMDAIRQSPTPAVTCDITSGGACDRSTAALPINIYIRRYFFTFLALVFLLQNVKKKT